MDLSRTGFSLSGFDSRRYKIFIRVIFKYLQIFFGKKKTG